MHTDHPSAIPTGLDTLVERLVFWLRELAPEEQRFSALAAELTSRFGSDPTPVTARRLPELEQVIHRYARHLTLEYVPDGTLAVDREPQGWPPVTRAEVETRAAWVSKVERTADDYALLTIDNLDPIVHAAPYLDAAFRLIRGSRGLVLDLRRNGGGDPGTVAHIISHLLGEQAQQISTVTSRRQTRQWWTTPQPSGAALEPDATVVVLVSRRTYSSGEALAYHLQTFGRASVLGEATAGAADHVTPIGLTPYVRALVPEATVTDTRTGTNWEGKGVRPDVECDPDDAPAKGLEFLRSGR
ncbi:S41 family peptidase [Actinoplanes sp. URMC 104]|uniref:S41 family peptidase n=1 Tax=Actinoplanes sp. URMC 104 TaxID=3423409 RepID=UPI003F1B9483